MECKKITKRLSFLLLMSVFGLWLNLIVFAVYIAMCIVGLTFGNMVVWVFTGDRTFLDYKMSKLLETFLKLDTKIESLIDR